MYIMYIYIYMCSYICFYLYRYIAFLDLQIWLDIYT